MAYNRKTSSFPLYDTKLSPDAEKGQILLAHNMDKRLSVIVTKLPRWKHKGATVEIVRTYLNKLLNTNFNSRHIEYALERLVQFDVIGKRSNGDQALYFARPSTDARWAKVRVTLRGKR